MQALLFLLAYDDTLMTGALGATGRAMNGISGFWGSYHERKDQMSTERT